MGQPRTATSMKVSHLEENVAAVNIALSQEEFAALDHEGKTRSQRRAALVHGYRRGGILRGVGQMFTVAITGVCRAVQV